MATTASTRTAVRPEIQALRALAVSLVVVYHFSAENAPSPVQHFWSLSAEEQFYLGWPLLILLTVRVAGIRRVHIRRRSLAIAMGALTAGSLGYGIYATAADPAAAYFVTPTRAWEFGVGGLLALSPAIAGAVRARAVMSWLG